MMNSTEELSSDSTNNGTVEITYKTIGPARPSQIRVASHIKIRDLRNAIAEKGKFPVSTLRMILRGKACKTKKMEMIYTLRSRTKVNRFC
uniref:Uncharacterized protein At2g35360/T32F12.26 n=1 Tax=Arabidopsis thaliana TaxID=3702 RepID=Q84X33_ARATH|nr:hypothetical protein [Arabidopsis thaliana]